MPDTYFEQLQRSPFNVCIQTQESQNGTQTAGMSVRWGARVGYARGGWTQGQEEGRRRDGGVPPEEHYHRREKACVLPRRVGGGDEEVDDHSVTHVEAVLHCPKGEKTTWGDTDGKSDWKRGSATLHPPFLLQFLVALVTWPLSSAAIFNNVKPQVRALYYF